MNRPLHRWAQLDSAARYFLPREEDKAKVGKELGLQLSQALSKEELDSPASRKAACIKASTQAKAAADAVEKSREKTAEKRARGLRREERRLKHAEKLAGQEVKKNKRAERKKRLMNDAEKPAAKVDVDVDEDKDKGAKRGRLLLALRRTGPGTADYEFIPKK